MAEANMVWVDMEFTGLNLDEDVILEIASVITDSELNVLAEGPVLAVKQSENLLEGMDEWNTKQHNLSGLVERVRKSSETVESAQEKTLDFIKRHCGKGESPLCGNSVHVDRYYMRKHMPKLESYLNYRNIDVTAVKLLAKRWYPGVPEYEKSNNHLALSDIYESIKELEYYRERIFRNPDSSCRI